MKVIDLLNKIANGEEVPKKIKVNNDIYEYRSYMYCTEKANYQDIEDYLFGKWNFNILNEEVEIIEDKPFNERVEKITNMNCIDAIDSNCYERYSNKAIALDINTLRHQINKIIDYIKEEK